jgi:hypothetical protein
VHLFPAYVARACVRQLHVGFLSVHGVQPYRAWRVPGRAAGPWGAPALQSRQNLRSQPCCVLLW